MNKFFFKILLLLNIPAFAQNITLHFPYLKGKTYDFSVNQGSETIKILENAIIPEDGKFVLKIPQQYAPYTGLGHWYITGTHEGGGLDMVINGKDFSVFCNDAVPNQTNIVFENNLQIQELNTNYQKQQLILSKLEAMQLATKAYSQNDAHYNVFKNEFDAQIKAYEVFQNEIQSKNNYAAKTINFINITNGIGTKYFTDDLEKANNILSYILNDLDWNALYTSGYWRSVIINWVTICGSVYDDNEQFAEQFAIIANKLNSEQFIDFTTLVVKILNDYGKDQFINAISTFVKKSGKIEKYEGALSVFAFAQPNEIAPDLILGTNNTLKATEFATQNFNKTLLIFYESGCGSCNAVINELKQEYNNYVANSVRIIAIASDRDQNMFIEYSKSFPWNDVYCDTDLSNINFKNYAVLGTPTIFLIDKKGEIVVRSANLQDIKMHL